MKRKIMKMLKNAKAYTNLGILFLMTKRPEEARKGFEIAKELFENQGSEEDVMKVKELLANIRKAR